jgi:hypothetical protein
MISQMLVWLSYVYDIYMKYLEVTICSIFLIRNVYIENKDWH